MASIIKVRGKWRAVVRKAGIRPVSKSFEKHADAKAWAAKVESGAVKVNGDGGRLKVAELIRSYIDEVDVKHSKRYALEAMREALAGLTVADLTPARLTRWARARGVSKTTVTLELSHLSSVLTYARLVWRLDVPDVMVPARSALRHAGLIGRSKERTRRPTADELESIMAWFDRRSSIPMRDILRLAVLTSMRRSEINGLEWRDFDAARAVVMVRNRKHPTDKTGNDQLVPLPPEAVAIIARQPKAGSRVFPGSGQSWSVLFRRACLELGIQDLRLHDMRREAISSMLEAGFQLPEVQLFSGHRDLNVMRRYMRLDPLALARRLNSASPEPAESPVQSSAERAP